MKVTSTSFLTTYSDIIFVLSRCEEPGTAGRTEIKAGPLALYGSNDRPIVYSRFSDFPLDCEGDLTFIERIHVEPFQQLAWASLSNGLRLALGHVAPFGGPTFSAPCAFGDPLQSLLNTDMMLCKAAELPFGDHITAKQLQEAKMRVTEKLEEARIQQEQNPDEETLSWLGAQAIPSCEGNGHPALSPHIQAEFQRIFGIDLKTVDRSHPPLARAIQNEKEKLIDRIFRTEIGNSGDIHGKKMAADFHHKGAFVHWVSILRRIFRGDDRGLKLLRKASKSRFKIDLGDPPAWFTQAEDYSKRIARISRTRVEEAQRVIRHFKIYDHSGAVSTFINDTLLDFQIGDPEHPKNQGLFAGLLFAVDKRDAFRHVLQKMAVNAYGFDPGEPENDRNTPPWLKKTLNALKEGGFA